jgi:glycosyltransferase involved in cell wall biosynthesis
MVTKNGMPFVREAVASLAAQTFRDYEVIVQDAVSSDGTTEFLQALQFPAVRMVSEQDSGLGDAYNRAFARCAGEIVGTLDSDNLLLPGALDTVDALFRKSRRAVALYGAVRMIDASGLQVGLFEPAGFDRRALMRCELVPPMSTTFFDRQRCGPLLQGDASITTVHDFDLLLRLSGRTIVRTTAVLGATRLSEQSMTRNPENYERFCSEKILALERFIHDHPALEQEGDAAVAGIYCWAAESILDLEGPGERFESFVERAEERFSTYDRVLRLRDRLGPRHSTSHTP